MLLGLRKQPVVVRAAIGSVAILIAVGPTGACSWKNMHLRDPEEIVEKFGEYHRKFGEIAVGRPVLINDAAAMKVSFGFTARELYEGIGLEFAARVGQFDVQSFKGALKFELPTVTLPVGGASGGLKEDIATGLAQALLVAAGGGQAVQVSAIAEVLQAALAARSGAAPASQPTDEADGAGAGAETRQTITRSPLELPALPDNAAATRVAAPADAANVFGPLPEVQLRQSLKLVEANNTFSLMRLLELRSDPSTFELPPGYEPVLMIGSITVSPGTVTRSGFLAEVTLKLSLSDEEGEALKAIKYKPISAHSLVPTGFGQNMSLQSLTASQRDLALALSAAGYSAAGQALLESSRLSQQNILGVNQRVTISAFTRGVTNQFGYRIRGEAWSAAPTSLEPAPVELLQELNLPFAVIVGLPRKDIEDQIEAKVQVALRSSIETRWVPATEERARDVALWHPELELMEGYYRAHAADSLRKKSEAWIHENRGNVDHHYREQWARNAVDSIYPSGLSGYNYVSGLASHRKAAATTSPPEISDVYPTSVPRDRQSIILIRGAHFGSQPVFTLAGVPATTVQLLDEGIAAVVVDPVGVTSIPAVKGNVAVATANGVAQFRGEFKFIDALHPKTTISKGGKPDLTVEEQSGGSRALGERSRLEALIRDVLDELRKQ
jgi:hypothetical protein